MSGGYGRGGERGLSEVEQAERAIKNIENTIRELEGQIADVRRIKKSGGINIHEHDKLKIEKGKLKKELLFQNEFLEGRRERLAELQAEGHVDLRRGSGHDSMWGASGRLWRQAIAGVRSESAKVKAEEAKMLEYVLGREAAAREAGRDRLAFALPLDDPEHPLNFGDLDDRRTRAARNEEKRGRSILEKFRGEASKLFSTDGAGAHSFSANGQRYLAKDLEDARFKPAKYGAPGPWPFETDSDFG